MFPVEMEYAELPAYNDKRPVWEQAADAFSRYVHGGGEDCDDVLEMRAGGAGGMVVHTYCFAGSMDRLGRPAINTALASFAAVLNAVRAAWPPHRLTDF